MGVSCPRPRLRTLACLALASFVFMLLELPYDNVLRLAIRFNLQKFIAVWMPRADERWVYTQPEFQVDLGHDLLVILKTGYGTKERVPAWLDSLSEASEFRDINIIADYASRPGAHFRYRGEEMPVNDMVRWSVSHPSLFNYNSHPKVQKYRQLANAVASGDEESALQLSKSFGWELDALKFLSGLYCGYSRFPNKKWYLLVDDDTFIIQPSLKSFLGHLKPDDQHYLGNAIGSFRTRFAHGGSAIIVSRAAMHYLVVEHAKDLSSEYLNSLDETWGDRLLARAFLKIGVYLDETYSHWFNGEPPLLSRIRADRICSPVISFHGLSSPSKMRQVGAQFGNVTRPVLWLDIWDISGSEPPWRGSRSARSNWDYVGRLDEFTHTLRKVATADKCLRECDSRARTCLAWTWEPETQNCHISPWMIVGEEAMGKMSGVNIPRARYLEAKCMLNRHS